MTKIYEALEQAGQARTDDTGPLEPFQPSEATLYSGAPKMEGRMIGLYHTISSLLPSHRGKIIQFIGSRRGEGTSTLVRELANVSTLNLGKSVLLLDADHYHFSLSNRIGVTPRYTWEELLLANRPVTEALCSVGTAGLHISQIIVPAVLEAPQFPEALSELKNDFDLILIDSPPATMSPDGIALAAEADGVILVVEAECTRWQVAGSVRDDIAKQGGNLLGVVFNRRRYHIPPFVYKRL